MALSMCRSANGIVQQRVSELLPASNLVGTQQSVRVTPLSHGSFRSQRLVVRAATSVSTKFNNMTPLGDRLLVKVKAVEEKTTGGLYIPSSGQSKPNSGEVVGVGAGRVIGDTKVPVALKAGDQVVYSKFAGTEVDFKNTEHVLLKEDDVLGLMSGDDIKNMKPLTDRVLVKVAEAEEKTAGGVLLTDSAKEKPMIGTIIAVGPGPLGDDGKRRPLDVSPGNTVLYAKYAGTDFKGKDGTQYVVLRASDLMAILS